MNTKLYDWKDVANAQFSKALSLALVLLMFAMMVTPKIEVKKQKFTVQQMELVDIPMEERQKEEPPETEINIDIPIIISEDLGSAEEVDIKKYEQIVDKVGNIFEASTDKVTKREDLVEFVPYDDAPVIVGNLSPEYPAFARNAGLQGTVVLEVEVYRDGSVGEIRVRRSLQRGPGGLDEAAINAVRKVRFQPGKSSGQPVDTMVIIPIEFKLN
jgi:protein TonB